MYNIKQWHILHGMEVLAHCLMMCSKTPRFTNPRAPAQGWSTTFFTSIIGTIQDIHFGPLDSTRAQHTFKATRATVGGRENIKKSGNHPALCNADVYLIDLTCTYSPKARSTKPRHPTANRAEWHA
jgi:hypothetical protein